jgi:nucleoid-associated protein YgaU
MNERSKAWLEQASSTTASALLSSAATSGGAVDAELAEEPSADTEGSDLVGPEGTTHTVKAGDMLMKLAKKYYGDESKYKLIMDANKITDPNKIAVGDVLKIPPLK